MRLTSGYPQFNGSHLGLPPVLTHRMTGLGGGNLVSSMIWHMCAGPIRSSSDACACCLHCQVILFSCGFFFSTFSVMEKLVARAPHLINKGKDDGFTPLHLAAFNNHVGVATVLLQQVGCFVPELRKPLVHAQTRTIMSAVLLPSFLFQKYYTSACLHRSLPGCT